MNESLYMKLLYLTSIGIGVSFMIIANSYIFQTQNKKQHQDEKEEVFFSEKISREKEAIVNIQGSNQTDEDNPSFVKPPESTCINVEKIEQQDEIWSQIIGSPYDADGRLLPEMEYIAGLETKQIEDLAKQGYARAMVILSMKFLKSDTPADIKRGRKWAYQAAANGIISPLTDLAVSYLNEYQQLTLTGDVEASTNALIKYESTLRLFEHLAPGSASGLLAIMPLTKAQTEGVAKNTAKLVSDYKQQREQLGFGELSIAIPSTANTAKFNICKDYFAATTNRDS